MTGTKKQMNGSLTVEAAWITSMVLLSILMMFQQAGRIHDETKASMVLHEAVEKGRHGRMQDLEAVTAKVREHAGLFMTFSDCNLTVKEKGTHVYGKGTGGAWSREIEMGTFRPETFLRKITLIEGMVKEDGN